MHSFGYQFCNFYPKNVNFIKSFYLPLSPLINNSQTKSRDVTLRNAPCTKKKTDFIKNAQFWLLILTFFYPKNVDSKKLFCLPLPPPTNNSETKNCDDPWKNALQKMILLKMQFWLLILSLKNFTLKSFYSKNANFKKIVLSCSSPPTNNLQTKKIWWSMKKCSMYCENTDFAKNAQFRLLILLFFTLKMRISKNRSIFLFPHLLTTHKPKIVMIHEEMHPVLRKQWFC